MVEGGSDSISGWRTDSTGAVVVRYRVEGQASAAHRGPGEERSIAGQHRRSLRQHEILKSPRRLRDRGRGGEKPSQLYVTVKPKRLPRERGRRSPAADPRHRHQDPQRARLAGDGVKSRCITDIVYDGDTSRVAGVYLADHRRLRSATSTTSRPWPISGGLLTYFGGDQEHYAPISVQQGRRLVAVLEVLRGRTSPPATTSSTRRPPRSAGGRALSEAAGRPSSASCAASFYPSRDGVRDPRRSSLPPSTQRGGRPVCRFDRHAPWVSRGTGLLRIGDVWS